MTTIDAQRQRDLKTVASDFTGPNNLLSVAVLIFDYAIYASAVVVAVVASSIWVKVIAAVLAGTAISMLFILGHDAAHKSLTSNRTLNAILGRLVFLPCLHNYTLWVIQHNRIHHQATNVRGLNSFTPLSPDEFSSASFGRRALERLYRSPLGFGLYYLVHRWWKDKFFPRADVRRGQRVRALGDFFILCAWLLLFIWVLVALAPAGGDQWGKLSAVFWGLLLPFAVWNQLMGTTAFLQHTHPSVPWFRTRSEAQQRRSQAELTVLVQYPAWYDVLSHNIMQHQAHHINARIPWFRLKAAQSSISPLLGSGVVVEKMGMKYILRLVRVCQLYDYDSNSWLTFAGHRTSASLAVAAHASFEHGP